MAIVRWAPFSAFTSLERELQSMLDRFSTRPWIEGFGWKPDTDVYREDGDLIVRSELPGIDPDSELDIQVDGNVLHIKGEKKSEKEVSEESRYLKECRYGMFQRDVMLPEGFSPDDIEASYDNGVLTVKVPLPAEVAEEPKKVVIDVSTSEKQHA